VAQREVTVPDIGDFEEVEVVEVLVAPGDRVEVEDSLITLESDKASMEIPAPFAGVVERLLVRVGDQVSEGAPIVVLEVALEPGEGTRPPAQASAPQATSPGPAREATPAQVDPEPPPAPRIPASTGPYWDPSREEAPPPEAHAGPSVRRLGRELGVDLTLVQGSGRKGRILKEDVEGYVKSALAKGTAAGVPIAGVRVAPAPEVDFGKFGPTELEPLGRIRKLSAANLHRSWVTVPHVTQFEEADVTDLEAFRREHKATAEAGGFKLTFLPFVVKAVTRALAEFPHFNASLDHTGESLILKRYFHIGVAVDTPRGLVVPVIREADQKGILELAAVLQDLSERARDRKLKPADMQGGSFSVSSLGGIGGTCFTPIVNHPEVAILGVSRMEWRPVWRDGEFVPRRMLPLSLSYDHRVIDGADAARFTARLARLLSDLRLMVL
jgi:pyruvate dehydrogenase E2 component (dihydrolipoamide acetyltransferase)